MKQNKINFWFLNIIRVLALVGVADSAYLTWSHFQGVTPVCAIAGCEVVLTSSFATVGIIPLSLLGLFYYLVVFGLTFWVKRAEGIAVLLSVVSAGFLTSLYLVYLQLYVIQSICLYCMISAAISVINFLLVLYLFGRRYEKEGVL